MQTIYYNGTILKMDDKEEAAQAVLVEDGRIAGVGSLEEVKEMAKDEVEMYDLAGRTLMPSFIDAHSHITMASQMMMYADLTNCSSFADIVQALKEYAAGGTPLCSKVIVGFGYDHNVLEEERHPDKMLLDKVSEDIPVFIIHVSGHMGVMNSKGLMAAQITEETPDPEGGHFGRLEGSLVPDGYLEEAALMQLQYAFAGHMQVDAKDALLKVQQMYLQYGVTTVQDGASAKETIGFLKGMAENGLLKLDVVAYPVMNDEIAEGKASYAECNSGYENHFRVGGYKVILDGSPQGKSAWLSKPYENEETYCGYPWLSDEKVLSYCKAAIKHKRQLLAHCNGDAASEQYLNCYENALKEIEDKACDLRPVMIHCQTVRKDQIERMEKLDMIASVFVGHVYYWGDVHLKNLGEARAMSISPVGTALKHNLIVTFHQDTPVTKPDMLHSVWCAVERHTKKGVLLNKDECVSVYEALKAVTINAAYQYHEEAKKGSIENGKNADLVILDKNPLEVPYEQLKDIQVDVTIKDGKHLYTRNK